MRTIGKAALCVLAIVTCTSCRPTGFQFASGKPAYVSWDEASGTRVSELDADPKTFTLIPHTGKLAFAKDADKVFMAGSSFGLLQIQNADPPTFKILNDELYTKDAKHAYFEGAEIEGADAATFDSLPLGYAKDAHHAYIGKLQIPADVATFEPLNFGSGAYPWDVRSADRRRQKSDDLEAQGWSRDSATVYYGAKTMPQIDLKTFNALGRYYAKDAKNVYYGDKLVNGADPKTFTVDPRQLAPGGANVAPNADARDQNHAYCNGELLR